MIEHMTEPEIIAYLAKLPEQEIIAYLRENGTKGVVFGFMPKEVKEWCRQHKHEPIFQIYVCDDIWTTPKPICCKDDMVYSLFE